MESTNKKTTRRLKDKECAREKSDRIMKGVAYWASFYRHNPQRFCSEYLNLRLKLFQKILIYAMMHNYYFMYLASRGQGKTFLTAIYLVCRAILFPQSKIIVASSVRSQANESLNKIVEDLMVNYGWGSENLRREIKSYTVGQNKAEIIFKNGSFIKVATASDSGRGMRGNVLVVDEFRMVDKSTIDTVLKRFLTTPRQPAYLNNPKYKHLLERNVEIYLSSAWNKGHWSWEKAKSYVKNMLDSSKKYFICGLPYQIAIKEGLLMRSQVEDEMSENDFNELIFQMEMECLWMGDTDGSFFDFDNVNGNRRIKRAIYPPNYFTINKKLQTAIPDLEFNERRILSVDVALMASKGKKKNDASAIIINRAIPLSNKTYQANIVYLESHEGMKTEELALQVRRLFEQFKCTDLVIDTNGVGLGVYDLLVKPIYDNVTGKTYCALTCVNDKDMAERCKDEDALEVIWSVKASASFNTEICILLRNGFANGNINMLISEMQCDEIFNSEVTAYHKMPATEKALAKLPYLQTSLLIYELVRLESEIKGTNVKLQERSGDRKDRYSSLAYNYYVMCELQRKYLSKTNKSCNMQEYASKMRRLNKRPVCY